MDTMASGWLFCGHAINVVGFVTQNQQKKKRKKNITKTERKIERQTVN